MSILLIRHGETALNAARVLQPPDTPLSDRGIAQAEALAARLGGADGLGVARILSSDLPRARRTAEAIAAATGAPIETTPLLHERNFGALRGRPYAEVFRGPGSTDAAPPGGESRVDFERRVAEAFELIVRRRDATDGNLAVVTHGLVIGALLSGHATFPPEIEAPEPIGNTGLSVLDAQAPHTVRLLNCTLHLAAEPDPAGATAVSSR